MLLNYFTRSYKYMKNKMLGTIMISFLIIFILLLIKYDREEDIKLGNIEIMTKGMEKEMSNIMKLDDELSSQIKSLQNQIEG